MKDRKKWKQYNDVIQILFLKIDKTNM
jgi:hypothetical protein